MRAIFGKNNGQFIPIFCSKPLRGFSSHLELNLGSLGSLTKIVPRSLVPAFLSASRASSLSFFSALQSPHFHFRELLNFSSVLLSSSLLINHVLLIDQMPPFVGRFFSHFQIYTVQNSSRLWY